MASENLNMDDIDRARRDDIADSIKVLGLEELKQLGESLFPYFDHPWRTAFFTFLDENPNATFHHASTTDRIHFIYCGAQNKGIWFIPGSGVGPLQDKGLNVFKEILSGKK